jgi:hypothetical protein
VIHYIAWKREWRAHHQENYPSLQGDALRRVLVDCCLRPADKERVRYRSTVAQVWEYLDRAYHQQDVFLYDLMKPVLAHKARRTTGPWRSTWICSSGPSTSPRRQGCCL